jgi:hypothetical protein
MTTRPNRRASTPTLEPCEARVSLSVSGFGAATGMIDPWGNPMPIIRGSHDLVGSGGVKLAPLPASTAHPIIVLPGR